MVRSINVGVNVQDTIAMTPAFRAVNGYLGWGEPCGGVWFVGIEEADNLMELGEDELLARYRDLEGFSPHGEDRAWVKRPGNHPIPRVTSLILSKVSAEAMAVDTADRARWYLQHRLWAPKSRTLQANLYPLGKPRLKDWPPGFRDLFGFGPEDAERYRAVVAATRWPVLHQVWQKSAPQATVCFGSTAWEEFREAFQLSSTPRKLSDGKIELYDAERVALMHHFSTPRGIHPEAEAVGAILRDDWNVRIP